jgi:hypothetical protein
MKTFKRIIRVVSKVIGYIAGFVLLFLSVYEYRIGADGCFRCGCPDLLCGLYVVRARRRLSSKFKLIHYHLCSATALNNLRDFRACSLFSFVSSESAIVFSSDFRTVSSPT